MKSVGLDRCGAFPGDLCLPSEQAARNRSWDSLLLSVCTTLQKELQHLVERFGTQSKLVVRACTLRRPSLDVLESSFSHGLLSRMSQRFLIWLRQLVRVPASSRSSQHDYKGVFYAKSS